MNDVLHAIVMSSLSMALGLHSKAWQIRVLTAYGVEVSGGRTHMADICVVTREKPLQDALHEPPLLCVEIVSSEDKAAEMERKIQDYLDMGVRAVWEIYPAQRKAYAVVSGVDRTSDTQLTVPGTDILVYPSEFFDELRDLGLDSRHGSTLND